MRRCTAATAVVMVLVACLPGTASADSASRARPPLMRKAPYVLYGGDNTEVDVHWQLLSTDACTIDWGTDVTYSTGADTTHEYGTDHQHSHTITGLSPGALYHYRVIAAADTYRGTFRAAPPEDATRLKFLAYGDTRTYPADHDAVAYAIVAACASDPDYQTLILHVGDLVADGNLESHWDQQFFDPQYEGIQMLLGNVAFQAVIGNHEGTGLLFQKYFPYPYVADRYWSFDYGPCHFTVVDQYVGYGPGSAQLTWLENDLATTTKPWKVVYLHEPGWSSGGGHENEIPVQDYIQPLCEQYGVAIVLGGHNHYYARASVSGIEHLTTGGGGAPLRTPETGYPFIVTTASEFHFCKVEIDGSSLICEVLTPEGAVLDLFEVGLPLGVDESVVRGQSLRQNTPNPFNPLTNISFTVPEGATRVKLTIHDVGGRELRTLIDQAAQPGPMDVTWDGRDDLGVELTSGVYFARLSAGGSTGFIKMMLLK